ncbi:MAG TPA: hypothetical protein VIY53_10755 [Acidobacteriaceae bacterium]
MPEIVEEQPAQQLDLGRYVDMVRRRHMFFLIPLLFGWMLVWGASWVLPARYKSTTTILVEQPTMPKDYVVPNINDDLQSRLQSIQQQILSPTRLLMIIEKLHLYDDPELHLTSDEKVRRMSKDIDIETVHDPGSDIITGFSVSYSAPTARVAQVVAGEVTNLFIDENLREREQESQDTTTFMQRRLADARTALAEQDAKVRDFEAAHEGALPDQQASNLQILSGLQSQLQNEESALNAAKEQRVYFQSLIEQYRSLHATPHNAQGQPMTGLAGIDEQLARMRSELADLSTKYTDQYPAVQSLKAQISKTEKLRDQTIAGLKAGGAIGKTTGAESSATDLEDPSQSAPLLQLQSQLQANQVDISNREQTIGNLKARISSYQERLNAEPANEQQLADLTRGYDQSKANYDDLLRKENESAMATSMEQMQQGERFTQLDPPSLPTKPDFPNRLKFCGAGLGIGIVLGVVVAGAFEFFDGRMHGESDIKKLLPVAVISEIPEVVNPLDLRRSKWRTVVGWAVAVIVFVIILTGSALSYLHA